MKQSGRIAAVSAWWLDSRRVARVLHPRREMHARLDLIEDSLIEQGVKLRAYSAVLAYAYRAEGLPVPEWLEHRQPEAPRLELILGGLAQRMDG